MEQEQFTPDRKEIYGYRLDRILGRGGSATVYRAVDPEKGRAVAIKLFHASFFRNRLHVRDLAKCVKKFQKFSHPNIVQVYDFISEEDGECLIMEYVDGPSLRWYIENRPWNLRERLGVCTQICLGLQYLHDNGFHHHDLKPANVLFTRKGTAKLTDYALVGNSWMLALFNKSMHDMVTPMFVPPDFLRKEKASPQSDMYSFGVTMYLMFAGRLPFVTDTMQKLYECHLRVTPEHPSLINPQCPHELGDIIMRLLEKNPAKRFKECDELRIALSEIGKSRI